MRLAFVTTRYPPHTGGVETHVAELATRFAARGHEVVVHTADARSDEVDGTREVRDGVRVRRHRGVAPGGAFHVAPGVVTAVTRTDADLVHAHNYHSLPLVFAALGRSLSSRSGPPLVATPHYHGGSASALRDRLLSVYRPLGRWALRRSDAVVAVSEWERERLHRDLGITARVIPNGLDVERFAAARRAAADGGSVGTAAAGPAGIESDSTADSDSDSERPYLLCVGRLEAYKGVQHVVRALRDLPEYDLVVAGAGPYGEDLRRVAREAGVTDRVRFAGYVPDAELPPLYAGAAAFVTMSRFEAYGMTVAEALAAGTPCVVRPAGALVDWADRADCVAAEPDALPAAVREAVGLDAPAQPLPTWDEVADRVEAVYEDVLAAA